MHGRDAYYPMNQKSRRSVTLRLTCRECKRRVAKTIVPANMPALHGPQAEEEFLFSEFYRIGWRGVKTATPICRRCRRW